MYKGAVFFDYDGTLTDENIGLNFPTPKTIYTLEKLRANGYATFLTTGRMKPCTTLLSGKFTGLITSNGAYAEIDGQEILNKPIEISKLNILIDFMEKENIKYALETKNCAYTNGLNDQHFLYVLNHFCLAKSLFKPLSELKKLYAYKVIVTYTDDKQYQMLMEEFGDIFDIKRHRFCMSADINDKSTTKADGMKAIIEHLNIPIDHIYAVGDGENDAAMLKFAGHGIIMEEHSPDIEKYAEYVTKSVKNDGIYHALSEHYKLI